MTQHYDIIVIGSGAGGATLAQRLAPSGKSILILERGQYLPVEEENWDPKEVFINNRYGTNEKWLDRKGKTFTPKTHYWVGGNTIFYGAALYRFRKNDFERVEHYGGKISPAWPIRYEELAPYYTQAETLWNVHGTRGSDPTDDADAPPYPWPALRHDPEISRLKSQLNLIGVTPFDMPVAVERDDEEPENQACIRCRTCGGFPCQKLAKSDGRKMVKRALAYGNVTLLTDAKVTQLITDETGRQIESVQYESPEGVKHVSGDTVVLAAGAVNSAVLLLASKSKQHPKGLANGSDQVGRNYMFHTASASLSFAWPKIETNFPKTMAINDFYWRDPDGKFDYPMGHIQLLEYLDGDVIRGQVSNIIPSWLFPKRLADFIGDRVIPFLVMSEDLPEARNRVLLEPNGQIRIEYWHNNIEAHSRLIKKFHGLMKKAGRICKCLRGYRKSLDSILPLYGTAHQCGTLRMGDDPATSVVNADCRAHEVDNLYVVDTSVFVTSSAVNPALTCIANSLRVADKIQGANLSEFV
ncbi:MAG: GMC family oxidoreductase [Maricaulaceae bacterium]